MYHNLRIEIIKKFKTQADFSLVLSQAESKISSVLNGRRKLTENEAEVWKKALDCDESLLKLVTKDS